MRRVMRHPVRFLRHPAPFSCRAPDRGQRSRPMRSTSPSSSGGRCARRRRRKGSVNHSEILRGDVQWWESVRPRERGAPAGRTGRTWGHAGRELGHCGRGAGTGRNGCRAEDRGGELRTGESNRSEGRAGGPGIGPSGSAGVGVGARSTTGSSWIGAPGSGATDRSGKRRCGAPANRHGPRASLTTHAACWLRSMRSWESVRPPTRERAGRARGQEDGGGSGAGQVGQELLWHRDN